MIHLKSNSTQIKRHLNKEDEKVNSDNDYISTTVNQINSTNDNLSFNENSGKILSLLSEQGNDDKVINISRLDESLSFNNKDTKREKNEKDITQSNCELIIKNLNNNEENNDPNPVINISCLETKNNEDKTDNKINININNNIVEEKEIDKNKILIKKDEVFLVKKRNKICTKKRIILIMIIFCLFFSIFSILIIKKINYISVSLYLI